MYFFDTMTSYTFLCVNDSIFVEYTSPSILMLCVFFANTTGTPKCCATTQAIPIPEASIVKILLIGLSANRRLNSFPISLNKSISI